MKYKTLFSLVLLLLAIMPFFYMGYYYQSMGDIGGSLLLTIFFIGIMLLLMWLATLCRAHEGRYSKIINLLGWLMGVGYLLVGIIMIIPTASHFFYVNSEKKSIQAEADSIIKRTDNMFVLYKKQVNNRAARLEQEILNTRTTPNGLTRFSKAYPQKNYSPQLPSSERTTFYNVLMSNYNPDYSEWNDTLRSEFNKKLVNDFGIFTAPENVQLLATKVGKYSNDLQNGFMTRSPMERIDNLKPTFSERVTGNNLKSKFENHETSYIWNFLLLILLVLSCASFLLVRLNHVESRRGKDPIYEKGIPL